MGVLAALRTTCIVCSAEWEWVSLGWALTACLPQNNVFSINWFVEWVVMHKAGVSAWFLKDGLPVRPLITNWQVLLGVNQSLSLLSKIWNHMTDVIQIQHCNNASRSLNWPMFPYCNDGSRSACVVLELTEPMCHSKCCPPRGKVYWDSLFLQMRHRDYIICTRPWC